MATFRSRIWGWTAGQLVEYGRMADMLAPSSAVGRSEAATRLSEYAVRWAYYENKGLYRKLAAAQRRPVAMGAEWNPVPATVQFYIANTLGGALAIEPGEEVANPEDLTAAVERVWGWSNFEQMKREVTETAAVLGDVFVKVAEKRPTEDGPATAVYLQNIPPEQVQWWEHDERDFLTAIRIDTPRLTSIFTGEERRHTLVEVWRKEWDDTGEGGVRWYETLAGKSVDDGRLMDPVRSATFAELGYDFIPVVWAQAPTPWWHVTDQIDEYNTIGHLMRRLNRPTGVIHGRHTDQDGRPMPAPRVAFEEVETTYQEAADGAFGWLRIPGNAQFEWAQSPIDLGAAGAQAARVRQGAETSLPEYRVSELDASQIAASTLEMLLDQAGQRVTDLRGVLERVLARAQMMAISIGQLAGLEGFDAAGVYEAGQLEHTFVERGVFKPSATLQAGIVRELAAAGVPIKLAMKKAGFTDEEIGEFDGAAAEQALRERTTLAAQLARQRAAMDNGTVPGAEEARP